VHPYTRRDTAHVDPAMRPTKADYDRYIWLVEQARRLGWDEAAMARDAPFRVADPGMTFLLMAACRDLAAIGGDLGRDVAEIEGWIAELERGAAWLWNPDIGAYDARDLNGGTFAGALTNAAYLCWLGGIDDDRMLTKFDGMLGRVRYPVPSLDPADERFDARRYWRGPTWAMMNALIGLGLATRGHTAQAQALRRRTAHLIAEHGFAEYFDPQSGAPAGGGTFTWTAAIWLAWASPSAKGD
jgi:glycogen debranching enzyme